MLYYVQDDYNHHLEMASNQRQVYRVIHLMTNSPPEEKIILRRIILKDLLQDHSMEYRKRFLVKRIKGDPQKVCLMNTRNACKSMNIIQRVHTIVDEMTNYYSNQNQLTKKLIENFYFFFFQK